MHLLFILTTIIGTRGSVESRADDKPSGNPTDKWFTQYLNHFNLSESRTWRQRYLLNTEHYRPNGPVFLILNGEHPLDARQLRQGFVAELAEKFGAMCFSLEHRFYGESRPTSSGPAVQKLAYLSSEQALMDTAHFISGMRAGQNASRAAKWLVFGSSYAGSLATWTRLKYPHLVRAAVAQSAPLLAKVNYAEYYEPIDRALKAHSRDCYNAAAAAFAELYKLLRLPANLPDLERIFHLCHRIRPSEMTAELFNLYKYFLTALVFVAMNREVTVDEACQLLTTRTGNHLINLAMLNEVVMKTSNRSCVVNESSAKLDAKESLWIYQTCTEFGWYQTTTHRPFNVFSETIPVTRYVDRCKNRFGFDFLQTLELGVERTNRMYGGLDVVNAISNVVFIQGSNDPWSSAGVTVCPKNSKVSVITIEGAGHCPLILPPFNDPKNQVKKAIQQLESLIESWLKDK